MADKIVLGDVRFKRGPESRLPQLADGEPAVTTDTGKLFFGTPSGNVQLAKQVDIDNYTSQLTTNGKKIKGFINISEYGVVGDGVTDDQTPIVNAVAEAKLKGYAIHWGWDNKTYLTTASIPDFHKVKHIGNAIIKRGTDLFYLFPTGTQRNKIYAAASGGSNTFDGLSASQPVARLQYAFDWIINYGPVLTGFWEVVLTDGTFPNRATLKAGLRSENPIEIKGASVGGYPNVPTTIISEGTGASANAIFVSDGSRIKVFDIKFTGFNGSTSSSGIKASNGSQAETSNCHFDSCYWGVSGEGRSRIVVPDGIFNNCGYLNGGGGTGAAIRSLQLNNHAIGIQNAGAQTNTAIFQNCYQAALVQESSTGHVDWCTVQDCNSGIVVRVNSRVNTDGTLFKRNVADIRRDAPSHVFISSNTVFGTGADESTNKIVMCDGGITTTSVISGVELNYSTVEKWFTHQYINTTYNPTVSTAFYTATLKAPFWRGAPTTITPMKKLFFRIFGTINGTASNKRINIRLGSTVAGIAYSATENGVFTADGYIYFTGPDLQYVFLNSERHLGTSTRKSLAKGTNVMTSDVILTLEAQVDNVADSVQIDVIELGLSG
jgi:hypothetical protein